MRPSSPADEGSTSRLRLVLGVGRSGTTWTSRVLGNTVTPTRLIQEPLFHLRPRLVLTTGRDHTAIAVRRHLPMRHRLLRAYRCLLDSRQQLVRLGIEGCIEREDPAWQVCLVKEVHGLLATEAVVRVLACPTVLVVRDPISTVDSILRTNGFYSGYLENESEHLLNDAREDDIAPGFDRFRTATRRLLERMDKRQRIVLQLAFAVKAIQLLFQRLAEEHQHLRLVAYEDLCESAQATFRPLAEHCGVQWGPSVERYLLRCSGLPRTTSPYETRRIAAVQLAKRPDVLHPQEVSLCRDLLDESHSVRSTFPVRRSAA